MTEPQSGIQRQHELDALRAFAMLLGIALHAALSFAIGFPWVVQDLYPNSFFMWMFFGIHGFRMQLFFLISGFFTMMLWRRRGLGALLKQRAIRVFVPCILGMVTILPCLILSFIGAFMIVSWQDAGNRKETTEASELVDFIKKKDYEALKKKLADGADPNQGDPQAGIPVLGWASLYGDIDAARLLIEHGADVNISDREGRRPLHQSAFLGRSEIVELLIQNGADPNARGKKFDLPIDSTKPDWNTSNTLAQSLNLPMPSEADLEKGRVKCRKLLVVEEVGGKVDQAKDQDWSLDSMRAQYRAFINSDRFNLKFGAEIPPFHLITSEIFIHLWFLWFLCYLVVFFAIFALVFGNLPLPSFPKGLILSPWRWVWILPLTLVPQLFMGLSFPVFGPDTSAGVLPQPHVLFYYAIFFFFGAGYYDCDDREGQLCKWWWIEMPLALLIALPLGVLSLGQVALSGLIQVIYVWAMTFGMIGLFRTYLSHETKTLRYLSDSAYWLYLVHLPPMVLLQAWVRPWEISPYLKFLLVCVLTTGLLLLSYQYLVRYTWVGRLLNGPRKRPQPQTIPAAPLKVENS